MRTPTLLAAAALGLTLAGHASAQLSYTGAAVTQDFDTLAATGINLTWTNNVTLPGWFAYQRALGGPNATGSHDANPWQPITTPPIPPATQTFYNTSAGTATSGSLYSFGIDLNSQRTLGSICSGTSGDISYGIVLVNDTANTYTEFTVNYNGRQWRNGGNATAQSLEFDYKVAGGAFDATQMAASLENSGAGAGWTRVTALDFTTPVATATAGALVGTDPANTVARSQTVTGVSWGPGQYLYLRWYDDNHVGNDHAVGIDDFSFSTPIITPAANLSMVVSDSPDPLQLVGSNLTYTLQVNNVSLGSVDNTTITATFPAGVNFVSCSQGGTTFVGQNLTIPTGTIPGNGTTGVITLVMTPTVAFPTGSPLSVTFTANPIAGDADPANNSRLETTVVDNAADLSITNTSDIGGCTTTNGMPVTYTVTVNNTGPAPANGVVVTDTLPSNTTFNPASNATQGSIVNTNGVVTWNVGSLPISGSATLTLMATISSEGGLTNTASVSAATPDFATTNNSAFVRNNVPNTGPTVAVLLSTIAGSPSAAISVPTGVGPLPYEFVGTSFGLRRPFASPDGHHYVMLAETTAPTTENSVLIIGDLTSKYVVAREGYDVLDAGQGDHIGGSFASWDQLVLAVNDARDVGFGINTDNANTGVRQVMVKATHGANPGDPYTFNVVARQGGAATGVNAASTWGGTMTVAGMHTDGRLAWYSTLGGGGPSEALVTDDGTSALARRAVDIPTGQAAARADTYSGWLTNTTGRGFSMSPAGQWLADGSVNNPDSNANSVLVHNAAVAIQENSVIPGSSFTDGTRINANFNFNFMESDGHWFAYGANNGATYNLGQDWVVRDGAVIAKTGDTITATSTEKWADNVLARTYFLACGRGNDYCVGGFTDHTEFNRRVIVHNGTTVVLREGDPIDINQNGLNDDNAFVDLIQDNRACIMDVPNIGKVLLVVVNIRNSAICAGVTTQGQALLGVLLPPSGPVACSPADLVDGLGSPPGDGFVTGTDADFFVMAYNTLLQRPNGSYYADLTDGFGGGPDGFVTGTDADYFTEKYFLGC